MATQRVVIYSSRWLMACCGTELSWSVMVETMASSLYGKIVKNNIIKPNNPPPMPAVAPHFLRVIFAKNLPRPLPPALPKGDREYSCS